MAILTNHEAGEPSWFELATSDQTGAKQFYTGLFGWSAQDSPMGPDQVYTMFNLDGQAAGAAYSIDAQMKAQGVPPHWGVYFPAIDDWTAKVKQLGGSVIAEPFDVMDYGRMSVRTDPGGAVFRLWQAKQHIGTTISGVDHTVCWSELATHDAPQAAEFYSALMGWNTKGAAVMSTYIEFSVAGTPRGGILPMDENWGPIPSHWGIYFLVADCEAMTAKAKNLGATARLENHTQPGVGQFSMMVDPQGAAFSLIKPERM